MDCNARILDIKIAPFLEGRWPAFSNRFDYCYAVMQHFSATVTFGVAGPKNCSFNRVAARRQLDDSTLAPWERAWIASQHGWVDLVDLRRQGVGGLELAVGSSSQDRIGASVFGPQKSEFRL
jgi:hypothetical protein